jgi:hypothetical protein
VGIAVALCQRGRAASLLPSSPTPELGFDACGDGHHLIDFEVFLRGEDRVPGGVEFLGGFEHCFRAQGGGGVVLLEQGLDFADEGFGGGFRDEVALDLEFEGLLEEAGSCLSHDPQDGGVIAGSPVGIGEPDAEQLVARPGLDAGSHGHLPFVVGEVERLGQRDQLGFFDFERSLDGFELLGFVEDAGDKFSDLAVGVWQGRVGFGGSGGGRLGCDSREVDPLEPGCGSDRGGCCWR